MFYAILFYFILHTLQAKWPTVRHYREQITETHTQIKHKFMFLKAKEEKK